MREARYLACDSVPKTSDHARVPVTDAPPVRWKSAPLLMRQEMSAEDCMDRLILSELAFSLSSARLPRMNISEYPCTDQQGRPR
jgi:hypothetical protein